MRWFDSMHVPWYVVVSAAMVCFVGVLRLVAFHVEGHDDGSLTQLLTATVTLFTGSFVVARAAQGKNGNGDKKE